jgi:DNA-binding transcriptional LysR family regulator
MNLDWIRTFGTVARRRSFSRTARELNLSQPAVSKHIAALEAVYGVKLIDRSHRSVNLTEAGVALLPIALRILETIEEAGREMDSYVNNVKGALLIGASTIPGQYVLPQIIRRFRQQYPLVNISLEIADSGIIYWQVLENKLVLGAVGALQEAPGVQAVAFADDELLLVMPVGHPLAGRKSVNPPAVLNHEIIGRERGSGTRSVLEAGLKSAGISPKDLRTVVEMGSTEAALAAVEAGIGLSFVSRWAAEQRAKNGLLVLRRVKGLNLKRQLYLIYAANRFLPRPVQAFIEFAARR